MGSTFDGDNRRLMAGCFREGRSEILQLYTPLVSVATQGTTGRTSDGENPGGAPEYFPIVHAHTHPQACIADVEPPPLL